MKKISYSEPTSFFPKEIRKKNKIGEYAETKKSTKKATKKTNKRK